MVIVITIAAYIFAHDMATAERGYKAIGGEAFLFLIPLLMSIGAKTKRDLQEECEEYELD